MDSSLEEKLKNYQPAEEVKKLVRSTPILLLVGPTGAGKDALKDKLLETDRYHHIVSHTTRSPRINHGIIEHDGKDYHFIDKKAAMKMLDEHAFIEAKTYSGNLYGTSVSEIQKAKDEDKIAMTDIEVQGVKEYKALDPSVMAVFLLPPDFGTWQTRLRHRYGDVVDAADHRLRLQTALKELNELLSTDYYRPVVNDKIEHTFDQVTEVVKTHGAPTEENEQSVAVAKQLVKDIQNYLATSL